MQRLSTSGPVGQLTFQSVQRFPAWHVYFVKHVEYIGNKSSSKSMAKLVFMYGAIVESHN